jgi:MFS family permease
MALVGTLGFNFQAVLPLLARLSFDGGATAYAVLVSAMGFGAVLGALATGARNHVSGRVLAVASAGFGALGLVAAAAPSLALEAVALVPLGAASVMLAASINSALQLSAEPSMRGRVMALYSVVFLGSTPIGAPLAGWLSQAIDPRAALAMAGVSGLLAAALARFAFRRTGSQTLTGLPAVEL